MASIKLFKRIFNGTGKILGEFPSTALETVEKTFTRDDIADEGRSNQNGSEGEPPKTPPPPGQDIKDIDPPTKDRGLDDQNDDNRQNNPFGGNSNDNEEDGQPDKNWDRKGNDLDTEYMRDPDQKPSEPQGGGGLGGDSVPGEEESGPDGDAEQDGEEGQDGQSGQEGQSGENSQDGQSGQEGQDGQSSQDGQSGQSGDSGDSNDSGQDGQSGQFGDSGDSSDSGQEGQSGQSGDYDDSGDSGQDGDQDSNSDSSGNGNKPFVWNDEEPSNKPGSGGDSSDDGEGVSGKSIMEEALNRIRDGKSAIQKAKDSFEDEVHGEGEIAKESRKDSQNNSSKGEYNKTKNAVTDAIKKAQAENPKSIFDNDDGFSENDLLGDVGTGSITTLYKPVVKKKWQKLFSSLLEKALGFTIQFNPNLINKRIEDAPPGRESERKEIKNIMILLDCSGSMGSQAFIKVINHLDAMMKSYDLSSAQFVISGFGGHEMKSVISKTRKCRGKKLKATIMSGYEAGGSTYLAPALQYAVTKHKDMDAYLIFTDGGISDTDTCSRDPICTKFFKRNKDRIIWVLTTKNYMDYVRRIDDYSIRKKQYVVFQ